MKKNVAYILFAVAVGILYSTILREGPYANRTSHLWTAKILAKDT